MTITTCPSYITAPSSLAECYERADTRVIQLASADAGGSHRKAALRVRTKDLYSIKDIRDDDDTAAFYNTSPAKLGKMHIYIWPFDAIATTYSAAVNVSVNFKSEFMDKNDVLDS